MYLSNKKTVNDTYSSWAEILFGLPNTAQKMKFSIKNFFSKCDQIRRKLRIWSHLLKKSLMKNFAFCAVKRLNIRVFVVQRFGM